MISEQDVAAPAQAVRGQAADPGLKTLVALRGIEKSFGPTHVLKGVNFIVRAGEIHALLGGNGAGKSTLMRIATGELRRDGGDIELDSYRGQRPVVSVVHQELALLPELTVAENIGLVHARSGLSLNDASDSARIAREALMLIDPHFAETGLYRKAKTLSLHESQIVEIARALSTGAEVLLLDEPTANLTATETERLFEVLARLSREDRMGIVFVSHRMKEIRMLCDVCTIIRNGRTVVDGKAIAELTDTEIVEQMGQPTDRGAEPSEGAPETPVSVTLATEEISIPVRSGTILGLAGAPAGPSALIASLIGLGHAGWSMSGDGWPACPSSPRDAVRNGIGYVTGDRGNKGILAQLPIIDNVLASRRISQGRQFVRNSERDECSSLIEALQVRIGSIWDHPATLSGGNQQKLLIARWLGIDLKMIVLEEPTRGVDIGTKREIYALIREIAAEGTIIVWWSTENAELLELCHEILAFDTDGQARGLLERNQFNEDSLASLTGMAA